jgi:hypothetical protein
MPTLESPDRARERGKRSLMASGKTSPHETYCARLSADERTLITLRDELYGGSWDQMLGDLRDRLKGKPYIFKLVNRIQDDISRIEKLSDYEKKHKVNLAEYLKKKEAK